MTEIDATTLLRDFYSERLQASEINYQSVWGDSADWKAYERFKILEPNDFAAKDVILDLGCGNGLLCDYTKRYITEVNYHGVDVVPQFLEYVKNIYGVVTSNVNFFKDINSVPEADWFAVFGSLNKKWMVGLNDDQSVDIVYLWIEQIFKKAKKGIFINGFSSMVDAPKINNVHLDPIKILSMLGNNVKKYRIRHDLDFYEFSMMIRK